MLTGHTQQVRVFTIQRLPLFRESFGHHQIDGHLNVVKVVLFTAHLLRDFNNPFQRQVQPILVRSRPKAHPSCHAITPDLPFSNLALQPLEGPCQPIVEFLVAQHRKLAFSCIV